MWPSLSSIFMRWFDFRILANNMTDCGMFSICCYSCNLCLLGTVLKNLLTYTHTIIHPFPCEPGLLGFSRDALLMIPCSEEPFGYVIHKMHALPVTLPTVSKHWRELRAVTQRGRNSHWLHTFLIHHPTFIGSKVAVFMLVFQLSFVGLHFSLYCNAIQRIEFGSILVHILVNSWSYSQNLCQLQGSYRPWKVLELKCWDFQAWKVLEKGIGPGKPWKSPGILK